MNITWMIFGVFVSVVAVLYITYLRTLDRFRKRQRAYQEVVNHHRDGCS